MCCCLNCSLIRVGETISNTVTAGRTAGIHLLGTECCGNGEGVFLQVLNPVNLALVSVQLVADLTVSKVCERNNGCGRSIAGTPLIGDIVVEASTFGTVDVWIGIVGAQVNDFQVTLVTCKDVAMAIRSVIVLETTAIIDNQTVHNVDLVIGPTADTAAVCGLLAIDVNLNQTVLDNGTTITDTGDTAVGSIAFFLADNVNINVTAANTAAVPTCNTSYERAAAGEGSLHLQVLDNGMNTDVAEKSCTVLIEGHVVGDGVTGTVEDALEVLAVTANSVSLGALVNVCRQDGIGIRVLTIYEFCESLQVFRRTNLIDTIHIGECPCSCGDNAQQSGHTQIQ